MIRDDVVDEIISYFNENTDVFTDCIEELDSYNGILGDDRYIDMDDIDAYLTGIDVSGVLRKVFFGYDNDSWYIDSSGNKIYGAFNPNRNYFRFDGYENLVSYDYKDYSDFNDTHTVETMQNNRRWINTIAEDPELEDLFDKLEEAE